MTVDERMRDLLEAAGNNVEPSATDPVRRVLRRAAHRRRRLAAFSVAAVVVVVAVIGTLVTRLQPDGTPTSTQLSKASVQARALLARPLHLPALGPSATCPATPGARIDTSLFGGVALGSGPVRVLLADRGQLQRGRVDLGTTNTENWRAIQTLWFATPEYGGPFVVRGQRLSGTGSIEVQPDSTGLAPGSGPLVVRSGPTINTSGGYRTVPGSTWVTEPGCYGWQVDGNEFSEVIVVDMVGPR